MEYILTFENTNFAIQAERYLLQEGLQISVLPLPSQISAGCGICLRIVPEEIQKSLDILEKQGIKQTAVYLKETGIKVTGPNFRKVDLKSHFINQEKELLN